MRRVPLVSTYSLYSHSTEEQWGGPREGNGVHLDMTTIITEISQARIAKGNQLLRGCPGDVQRVLLHLRLWIRCIRRKPPKEREELLQRIKKPPLEIKMGWVSFVVKHDNKFCHTCKIKLTANQGSLSIAEQSCKVNLEKIKLSSKNLTASFIKF